MNSHPQTKNIIKKSQQVKLKENHHIASGLCDNLEVGLGWKPEKYIFTP